MRISLNEPDHDLTADCSAPAGYARNKPDYHVLVGPGQAGRGIRESWTNPSGKIVKWFPGRSPAECEWRLSCLKRTFGAARSGSPLRRFRTLAARMGMDGAGRSRLSADVYGSSSRTITWWPVPITVCSAPGHRSRRGPPMNATPDSMLADPKDR